MEKGSQKGSKKLDRKLYSFKNTSKSKNQFSNQIQVMIKEFICEILLYFISPTLHDLFLRYSTLSDFLFFFLHIFEASKAQHQE